MTTESNDDLPNVEREFFFLFINYSLGLALAPVTLFCLFVMQFFDAMPPLAKGIAFAFMFWNFILWTLICTFKGFHYQSRFENLSFIVINILLVAGLGTTIYMFPSLVYQSEDIVNKVKILFFIHASINAVFLLLFYNRTVKPLH